jgi:hypothetical protein
VAVSIASARMTALVSLKALDGNEHSPVDHAWVVERRLIARGRSSS